MKNRISSILTLVALVFTLSIATTPSAQAQCPMCKMGAESNLNNGGTAAKGLNSGILYMFATPYLVVGSLAFFWWYNRKPEEEDEMEIDPADLQMGKE